MRMSSLVGRQIKEAPKDAHTASHVFLVRGGYVRPVSAGIYSLLPLGKRIVARIEAILREEMDRIDGQEVLAPVVLSAELWEESGRYASVGPELLRFEDRNGKPLVLGMTHEEAMVHMVRTDVTSYKQLPVMIYQLQTKYRDEARPRAGLIRVREFTMKDAYSFHASQADLEAYYDRVHEAYVRIFARIGMPTVWSIESDTGMMGGSGAHEFMAIAEVGEDTIFSSPDGRYRANKEVATSMLPLHTAEPEPLARVSTPGQKTIDEVATFLGTTPDRTGKAVFYRHQDGGLVFAMIRGDLDVNEAKLRASVESGTLAPATDDEIRAAGSVPGFASPIGIDPDAVRVVIDPTVVGSSNLVVGGNEVDVHLTGFNVSRDLAGVLDGCSVADIASVRPGDPCPVTGEPLEAHRGIEVGNIFQLGTRYSASMNGTFLDEHGKAKPYVMGSYGIGVGRAMAAVAEQCHDEHGPIWPISIAPYQVHVVALNHNKEPVREAADALYAGLREAGLDVLLDDRNRKAGFMFADADLIGVPFRLVVSPKTLRDGEAELKARDGSLSERVALAEAPARVRALVDDAMAALTP